MTLIGTLGAGPAAPYPRWVASEESDEQQPADWVNLSFLRDTDPRCSTPLPWICVLIAAAVIVFDVWDGLVGPDGVGVAVAGIAIGGFILWGFCFRCPVSIELVERTVTFKSIAARRQADVADLARVTRPITGGAVRFRFRQGSSLYWMGTRSSLRRVLDAMHDVRPDLQVQRSPF